MLLYLLRNCNIAGLQSGTLALADHASIQRVYFNVLAHLSVSQSFAFQGGSGCCVILHVGLQLFAKSSDIRMHQRTKG